MDDLAIFNPNADLPAQFEYVDLESVAGTEMLSHRTELRDSAPSRAQRLAQFGDLFYQTVRPYQKNNYLYEKPDNNYVFSTGYAQMRPLVDGYFLLSLVQNEGFIKKVLDNCSGTSYPAINANVLSSIVVNSSSHRKEQIQVGCLFRRIDNLITLHQRKLDALKKIKSALLEKMFPKDGSNIPEIRFTGFTEAWEQRKLGDYLLLSTEKNTNLQYGIEDVLSVSWTAGVVNQIEFQGRSFAGSNLSGYDVAHHECVIYTKSPLKDEPFGIIKTNYLTSGIVSQLYAVYRTNSLGNPAFIETYFSQTARLNNYLRPLVNKGAKNTMNISDEEALKGAVIFPLLEEQDSISSLFLLIDRLITLHQREHF